MPLSKRDPANLFDMMEASEKVQRFLKNKGDLRGFSKG